jgi:hypothetical protein
MTLRTLRRDDVGVILEALGWLLGAEADEKGSAYSAWEQLIDAPGFANIVIESDGRLIGFGASVMVSEAFASHELERPGRGIAARVIHEYLTRSGGLLSRQGIAEANTNEGINIVILCGRWIGDDLTADEIRQTQTALARSFVEAHAGYHVKRILKELPCDQDVAYARATKVYRVLEFECPAAGSCSLGVIEAEDVNALANCSLAPLFQPCKAVLGLRPIDQELLLAAIDGATDRELAERLGISLASVKRRWEDIYEKALSALSLPETLREGNAGKRGMQKRHYLLRYLRQNQHELRPFLLDCTASSKPAATSNTVSLERHGTEVLLQREAAAR